LHGRPSCCMSVVQSIAYSRHRTHSRPPPPPPNTHTHTHTHTHTMSPITSPLLLVCFKGCRCRANREDRAQDRAVGTVQLHLQLWSSVHQPVQQRQHRQQGLRWLLRRADLNSRISFVFWFWLPQRAHVGWKARSNGDWLVVLYLFLCVFLDGIGRAAQGRHGACCVHVHCVWLRARRVGEHYEGCVCRLLWRRFGVF
jgi:hypothetical protein